MLPHPAKSATRPEPSAQMHQEEHVPDRRVCGKAGCAAVPDPPFTARSLFLRKENAPPERG